MVIKVFSKDCFSGFSHILIPVLNGLNAYFHIIHQKYKAI